MALINIKEDDINIIRCYSTECIKSVEDAVKWFSDARFIPGMILKGRIDLDDTVSGIWDNESTRVKVDISYEEMLSEVKKRYINRIVFWGEYYNVHVMVKVNIFKKNVVILTKKKNPADIESLEKALNLV